MSDASKKTYDRWYQQGHAHWEDAPGKKVFIAALRECAPADKPIRLLDVGCGSGMFLARIHREVSTSWELHGVDFSRVAIEQGAVQWPEFTLTCADATSLESVDESFDIVTCYGSWEHFKEPSKAIGEAARVLKPDGWVIALLPTLGVYRTDRDDEGWYEDVAVEGHDEKQMQWNWVRSTWEMVFNDAGFKLEPDAFASKCGALKPGVFFFGRKVG